MTAQSSQISAPKTPCKTCNSCGLILNQTPLYDVKDRSVSTISVFWVGLSAVDISNLEVKIPLSPSTNSGKLIQTIERHFGKDLGFYKTNLVKCLPLANGKIRYPSSKEMKNCFPNLVDEIDSLKPKVVFLLGKQVSSFLTSQFGATEFDLNSNFEYSGFKLGNTFYIPVHHPSYILVYKRKLIDSYINGIVNCINRYTVKEKVKKNPKKRFVSTVLASV